MRWKKVIFSDEADFDLGGYVNKQNCRIWCGFWSKVIIGPFFFENEQEGAVTGNVNRYRAMLNEFLFKKIEEEDIGNIWFQQDGAMCLTAEDTLDVLLPVLEYRIASRRAAVVWQPRSCDLTPFGNYMWGAVKDNCYEGKPETIDDVREAIGEIQLHAMDNVVNNWTDRIGYCMAS